MKALIRSTDRRTGLAVVLPASAALAALIAGCVDDADMRTDVPGEAGTTSMPGGGTGGDTGGTDNTGGDGMTGGTGGAGMTGGFADDPTFGMGPSCGPIAAPLITDFTLTAAPAAGDAGAEAVAGDAGAAAPASTTELSFGDFTTMFSGGTFTYPGGGEMYEVASDLSQDEWHLTGSIGTYSGFGIYLTAPGGVEGGCALDASAYQGLSFSIRGNVAMTGSVTLSVGTSANQISHVWLNSVNGAMEPTNTGRCLPGGNDPANQYDGSCAEHAFPVPVTDTATVIEARWADFAGGAPATTLDPSEITSMSWVLPAPPGAGTDTPTPYDLDIVLDDLRFIE